MFRHPLRPVAKNRDPDLACLRCKTFRWNGDHQQKEGNRLSAHTFSSTAGQCPRARRPSPSSLAPKADALLGSPASPPPETLLMSLRIDRIDCDRRREALFPQHGRRTTSIAQRYYGLSYRPELNMVRTCRVEGESAILERNLRTSRNWGTSE